MADGAFRAEIRLAVGGGERNLRALRVPGSADRDQARDRGPHLVPSLPHQREWRGAMERRLVPPALLPGPVTGPAAVDQQSVLAADQQSAVLQLLLFGIVTRKAVLIH